MLELCSIVARCTLGSPGLRSLQAPTTTHNSSYQRRVCPGSRLAALLGRLREPAATCAPLHPLTTIGAPYKASVSRSSERLSHVKPAGLAPRRSHQARLQHLEVSSQRPNFSPPLRPQLHSHWYFVTVHVLAPALASAATRPTTAASTRCPSSASLIPGFPGEAWRPRCDNLQRTFLSLLTDFLKSICLASPS